jgi:phage gpG-like protein
MANKFNFGQIANKFKSLDLSLDMANTAKNDFLDNFKKESFEGKPWKKRKSDKQAGRKLLVKTGRLRRDVSNSVAEGHKNSNLSYTLIVNNPYAAFNNEGTNKMPQRQFVGMTSELNKKLLMKINQRVIKIWAI